MKLKCFIKGHETPYNDDCGSIFCNRCGSHEFRDENFWLTIPSQFRYYWTKLILVKRILFLRCDDCKKLEIFFGFRIKTKHHKDCLPF